MQKDYPVSTLYYAFIDLSTRFDIKSSEQYIKRQIGKLKIRHYSRKNKIKPIILDITRAKSYNHSDSFNKKGQSDENTE